MPGTLYVVATPIGNLDDLAPRARRVLSEVALIACEDTRHTAKLLARFGIDNRMLSCHKFNERERLEPILTALRAGHDVALVSDGGTPGVSDPGALLVGAVHDAGLRVSPIPGPSAVVAVLAVAGFEGTRFVFEGFLPHRVGERRRRLRELRDETRTIVAFETPHRIAAALRDIGDVFGRERALALGRELTKQHETVLRGTATEVASALTRQPLRGEIVLAIAGATGRPTPTEDDRAVERVRAAWSAALAEAGGDRREALRRAARALGLKRAELRRYLDELGE